MTPQEKDLIATLLTRLKTAGGQPKDAEAEALIAEAMREQPDAPYYLVQTVLIQDLSLHNAQQRIAELERQLAEAQSQAAKPTSFLGGLFGHNQPAPRPPGPPPAGPWSQAPHAGSVPPTQPTAPPYGQPGYGQPGYGQPGYGQPGYGQPMGGGGFLGGGHSFLRSAAATAAGVAGGALLFEGIQSMFGHHASAGILGGGMMNRGLGETVVNNYYGGDAGGAGDLGPSDVWGGDPGLAGGNFDQSYDPGQEPDQNLDQDQDLSGDFDTGGDDGSDWNC